MDTKAYIIVGCALAASLSVMVAAVAAVVEGLATVKAVEWVGRQPEAKNEIVSTLIIGNAITESNSIYGLLVSLLIIFVLAAKLG